MNRIAGFSNRPVGAQVTRWSVAPNVTHYEVLGVPKNATPAQVHLAFLTLSCTWHPIICRRSGRKEVYARILEAYEVLGDPLRRAKYDLSLLPGLQAPFLHPAVAAYQRTVEWNLRGTSPKIEIDV